MSTRKRKLSFSSSAKSKSVPSTPVVEPSPATISVPSTPVVQPSPATFPVPSTPVEPSPPNSVGSSISPATNDEPSHNQEHDEDRRLSVLGSIPENQQENQQVPSTCKIVLIIKLLKIFFLLNYFIINILFVNSAVN